MSDIGKAVYDSKKALPNKLLKEDGTVTDLAGNTVIGAVDAYDNKPALPNKWLNPDGSYSTLNEIVASMIDNELFIIVDELPAVGEENKIYLLTQDDKLIEYIWVNNKWDPVGMVEFDITNYYTKAEVTQLIETSLNSAKAYADTKLTEAKSYADTKAGTAEQNAKDYADGVASSEADDAETAAKAYADTKKTEAISSAKTYTDTAIQTSITQVLNGSY